MAYTEIDHPKRCTKMGLRSGRAQVKTNVLRTQEIGHATERSLDRVTAKRALGALALGAVLGSVGVLCSQWVSDLPLVRTALQSAVSMMVLGITTSARPINLTLDMQSLEGCPETADNHPHERQSSCWQRTEVPLGFATL
jgi:hypothetical protein